MDEGRAPGRGGVQRAVGTFVILFPFAIFPFAIFRIRGWKRRTARRSGQYVGVIVGIYGLGYVALGPLRHSPMVLAGSLGKILGPVRLLSTVARVMFPVPFSLFHAYRGHDPPKRSSA